LRFLHSADEQEWHLIDAGRERGFRNLAALPRRIRGAGAKKDRGDPLGMQGEHQTRPETAAGVSPQAPRRGGQLGMTRFAREMSQRLLKGRIGTVARVAPVAAILVRELLIRRAEQRAVPLPRQRLPVQIVSRGETGDARALAATVLMHN